MFTITQRHGVIVMLALALTGCGLSMNSSKVLEGTHWQLQSADGIQVVDDTATSLEFINGSVRGSAGCNSYGGSYRTIDTRIHFDDLNMTLMACLDTDGIMEQERSYFQSLQQVGSYVLSEDQLSLWTSDGRLLLFSRKPR